jgi:DNA-directed RNA polymerase subunit RPC12/RpoP
MNAMTTAEWICTRCGSTNRKLVVGGVTTSEDSCVTCHAKHEIAAELRPVRWSARPKGK